MLHSVLDRTEGCTNHGSLVDSVVDLIDCSVSVFLGCERELVSTQTSCRDIEVSLELADTAGYIGEVEVNCVLGTSAYLQCDAVSVGQVSGAVLIRVRSGNTVGYIDLTNGVISEITNYASSYCVDLLQVDGCSGNSYLSTINCCYLRAICIVQSSSLTIVSNGVVLTVNGNSCGILIDSVCGISGDLTVNLSSCNLQRSSVGSVADSGLAIKCASLNLQVNAVYVDGTVCAGVNRTCNSAAVGK